MPRRHREKVAGVDRSRQKGMRRRNIHSRCKHHSARAPSRFRCEQSRPWDKLRDSQLPRSACKHRKGKSNGTKSCCISRRLTSENRRSDRLFGDLVRETRHAAMWMRRDARCYHGISRPGKAVIRHFVPFFARDLASFAADANGRIGEETNFDVFLYVIVPTLVRAVCAFADHFRTVGALMR